MPPFLARAIYWPTFIWNALLGRVLKVRHWWDSVDGHLILGAVPLRSDVSKLSTLGVTGVVNTCDEYAGPQDLYNTAKIEQLWIPTVDFQPPTLDDVRKGVDFMHRHVVAGGKVYVHCKAGRVRSATVMMCYLIEHQGMTPDQAQAYLLKIRPHVNRKLAERAVVKEFAQELAAGKTSTTGPLD